MLFYLERRLSRGNPKLVSLLACLLSWFEARQMQLRWWYLSFSISFLLFQNKNKLPFDIRPDLHYLEACYLASFLGSKLGNWNYVNDACHSSSWITWVCTQYVMPKVVTHSYLIIALPKQEQCAIWHQTRPPLFGATNTRPRLIPWLTQRARYFVTLASFILTLRNRVQGQDPKLIEKGRTLICRRRGTPSNLDSWRM